VNPKQTFSKSTGNNTSLKPVQRRLLFPLAVVCLLLIGGFVGLLISIHNKNLDKSTRKILDRKP